MRASCSISPSVPEVRRILHLDPRQLSIYPNLIYCMVFRIRRRRYEIQCLENNYGPNTQGSGQEAAFPEIFFYTTQCNRLALSNFLTPLHHHRHRPIY